MWNVNDSCYFLGRIMLCWIDFICVVYTRWHYWKCCYIQSSKLPPLMHYMPHLYYSVRVLCDLKVREDQISGQPQGCPRVGWTRGSDRVQEKWPVDNSGQPWDNDRAINTTTESNPRVSGERQNFRSLDHCYFDSDQVYWMYETNCCQRAPSIREDDTCEVESDNSSRRRDCCWRRVLVVTATHFWHLIRHDAGVTLTRPVKCRYRPGTRLNTAMTGVKVYDLRWLTNWRLCRNFWGVDER